MRVPQTLRPSPDKRDTDCRCDCVSQRRPVSQVIGLACMTRREPLETRRQEGSGHSTIAPSLSVLRAHHEADRGRLSARRLELALLLVVVGFWERSRDHLAEWVTPGADRTRTWPSPPHTRRSRHGSAHRLWSSTSQENRTRLQRFPVDRRRCADAAATPRQVVAECGPPAGRGSKTRLRVRWQRLHRRELAVPSDGHLDAIVLHGSRFWPELVLARS